MARSGPVTKDTSTIALGLAQIRIGKTVPNIASTGAVLLSSDSIGALANTKYTGNVDFFKFESGFPLLEDLIIPMRESAMLECTFNEITPFNLAMAHGIDPNADVSATITEIGSVTVAGTTTGDISVDDLGGAVTDRFTVVFTSPTTASVYGEISGHVGDMANLTDIFAPDNGGNPYFSIPASFFSGVWDADETYTFFTTEYTAGTAAYASAHSGSIGIGSRTAPDYIRMEAVYTYPNGSNHMYIIFPRAQAAATAEIDLQKEDAAGVPVTFEAKRADSEVDGGNAVWDAMSLGQILFD
jgi:hypothetical protein